jgi:predicted AAA+ superfamily ATPase
MIETLSEQFLGFVHRESYSRQIRPYIGQRIIKVLTGQRRAGKSYILYQLMGEICRMDKNANIVYINTELAEFRNLENHQDLYDMVVSRFKSESNYVFIDEIQEIKGFEKAVQSLFAESRCDIFITGSNSHLLSGELATYLAGRYIQFQVHPLSYAEFLAFYRLDNSPDSLRKYLRIGGMPFLASLAGLPNSEALAGEYLRNLYESIALRDVIARENIRNIRFLESLASYLADNTGSLFSANNISKYLKSQRINIPVQTVISYLSALEKAILVHKVERIDVKGLKIFEINEKYYFEDIGLRNTLVRNQLPNDIGKLIENAVYLFLIQQHWTVYVGKIDSGEIDFAAEKDGRKLYVQAAYRLDDAAVGGREFGNLERVGDQFPKYVVSMDEDAPKLSPSGIHCLHLKDFLTLDL